MKLKHFFSFVLATQLAFSATGQHAGSIDSSFKVNTGPFVFSLLTLDLQADEKVVIAGEFGLFDGIKAHKIGRLNSDGSRDTTFKPNRGPYTNVYQVKVLPDQNILMRGVFDSFNGNPGYQLLKLYPNGSPVPGFAVQLANTTEWLNTFTVQSDGYIMVGGNFSTINTVSKRHLARLKPNGIVDSTFNSVEPLDPVTSVAVRPDGKILVVCSYNDPLYPRYNLYRLNQDGSQDLTFKNGARSGMFINQIEILKEDKILLSGGNPRMENGDIVIRLLEDGTVDSTFKIGSRTKGRVVSFTTQKDDKIIIAGHFSIDDEIYYEGLARLLPNGAPDKTFIPTLPATSTFATVSIIQPDGKIIAGGTYTKPNSQTGYFLNRYNADQIITGLNKLNYKEDFVVYPNPCQNVLKVKGVAHIYTLDGLHLLSGEDILNIDHLPKGLYVVKVGNAVSRVVKE